MRSQHYTKVNMDLISILFNTSLKIIDIQYLDHHVFSFLSFFLVIKYFPTIRLPPRMRQICVSLLKTIQEYDEAIEAAEEAQGSVF